MLVWGFENPRARARARWRGGAARALRGGGLRQQMFPLHDNVPARRLPAAVWALVFVNAAIFLHEVQLAPPELELFVARYALVPAHLTMPGGLERYWPTVITSMFLHGGWLHVIGNMWFLWIF